MAKRSVLVLDLLPSCSGLRDAAWTALAPRAAKGAPPPILKAQVCLERVLLHSGHRGKPRGAEGEQGPSPGGFSETNRAHLCSGNQLLSQGGGLRVEADSSFSGVRGWQPLVLMPQSPRQKRRTFSFSFTFEGASDKVCSNTKASGFCL